MASNTKWRESIAELPSADVVKARLEEGFRPIAIEWERSTTDEERARFSGSSEPDAASQSQSHLGRRAIPYGLRISSDCHHLEIDPSEKQVIEIIVAMIAGDHPLSKIAEELNTRHCRTREGKAWSQVSVFRLLPRVVEFGPEILSGDEWTASKKSVLAAVG